MRKKKEYEKTLMIEQLAKTPIIQVACEKIGLARSTFYRWKDEDKNFSKKVDDAIEQGSRVINDLAESQLIYAIKEGNLRAITFWLTSRHPKYSNKTQVSITKESDNNAITARQMDIIKSILTTAEYLKHSQYTIDDNEKNIKKH